MSNIVSRTLSVHQEHELLLKLEKAGLDFDLAQLVISSKGNEYAKRIVKDLIGYEEKIDLARDIFGDDFLSPEDISAAFPNLQYSDEQKKKLALEFPSEEKLYEARKQNCILHPDPSKPMFLSGIVDLEPDYFGSLPDNFDQDRLKSSSFFSRQMIKQGWKVVSKDGLGKNIPNKSQTDLLGDGQYNPHAAKAAWLMTAYRKVRGINLFQGLNVRTSSKYRGHTVSLGHIGSKIKIKIYPGDMTDPNFTISFGLKL